MLLLLFCVLKSVTFNLMVKSMSTYVQRHSVLQSRRRVWMSGSELWPCFLSLVASICGRTSAASGNAHHTLHSFPSILWLPQLGGAKNENIWKAVSSLPKATLVSLLLPQQTLVRKSLMCLPLTYRSYVNQTPSADTWHKGGQTFYYW